MRGKASRLQALLLVVLWVAAHFQAASCRGGVGHGFGGHGGGVNWRVSGCAPLAAAALVRWL
ncbi:hypothetical protein TRIUR3_00282 [Triticum urartu]|uniref:Uncharacterized protein n=1 Tax=Triticum urartu TaxID=4572 RepID=M8A891_TRIUA|nr:hypothetical protein TRIUR3_00282 [Triticum urartu]